MIPFFYSIFIVAAVWLGAVAIVDRFKSIPSTPLLHAGLGLATFFILLVPIGDFPLWKASFSLYPNPSLLTVGLVVAALWRRLFGFALLRATERRAGWIFGAVVGSVLYLHQMIYGRIDLYFWGWNRDAAIWCMAAIGVAFLAAGNRLGVLFLGALIAYSCDTLESANGWDYLIDPVLWLAGLGIFFFRTTFWIFARFRPAAA